MTNLSCDGVEFKCNKQLRIQIHQIQFNFPLFYCILYILYINNKWIDIMYCLLCLSVYIVKETRRVLPSPFQTPKCPNGDFRVLQSSFVVMYSKNRDFLRGNISDSESVNDYKFNRCKQLPPLFSSWSHFISIRWNCTTDRLSSGIYIDFRLLTWSQATFWFTRMTR